MRDKVRAFIARHRFIEHGDTVIVALSGGADSVSLLHVLDSLKEEYDLDLRAAHLNHMIRGEEAERDERFVAGLCEAWGIPLELRRADIPSLAEERGESLELCGRNERYRFFGELCECYHAKVATAHNRNDNTETVMLNLTRGTGLSGMGGIPPRRGAIIRPLLTVSRDEIEAYCTAHELSFVTDSTNADELYTRNRLRHSVLPLLRELNPSLDEGLMRMSGIMREADDYLNEISKEELKRCRNTYGYACEKLLRLPPAVLGYALRLIAKEAGATADFRHIELMTAALFDGGSVELSGGFTASCAQGTLRIIRESGAEDRAVDDAPIPLSEYKNAVRLRIEDGRIVDPFPEVALRHGEKNHQNILNNSIPCAVVTSDTVVRRRRAGDTFTDGRRGVTKTLKKLFNELKIPRERRDSLLLVARGGEVLWIEGVGTSKAARVSEEENADILWINI